jgi:hypothetical protein
MRGCSVAPFHSEQGIYENVDHISARPDNWRSGIPIMRACQRSMLNWINVGTYCASAKPCATPG